MVLEGPGSKVPNRSITRTDNISLSTSFNSDYYLFVYLCRCINIFHLGRYLSLMLIQR